ncbi:MAG: hypothetical protein LPJ96_05135 [Exiguobacterium sp.]|nr:hypothetical protein [Exiguobacterium sp.]MDX5424731.1 hypothetical protein [Exiguobacterium sp.]MDX6772206.1 hypothetical protein [Exiguobacterium sp.]
MDAYERSLKQQAERIRRELSQEGKKAVPVPKVETPEEFIPSDVPSPIYGYARPKPKINLPSEHSPETRSDLNADSKYVEEASTAEPFVPEATEETVNRAELFHGAQSPPVVPETVEEETETEESVDETVDVERDLAVESEAAPEAVVDEPTVMEEPVDEKVDVERDSEAEPEAAPETLVEVPANEVTISPEIEEPTFDATQGEPVDEIEEKTGLGDVSILEGGFASVFMGSTELSPSKVVIRDEKEAASSEPINVEETSVEQVAPIVEDVAKTLQTDTEQTVVEDEAELTPAVSVSYKAEGPPLNVMMTPQDRMAMYRKRRLDQKNNNL